MGLTFNDFGALVVLLTLAVWFAWLLRGRSPRTWPWSLVLLLPVAVALAVTAIDDGSPVYLWRFISLDEPVVPGLVVAVSLLAALVLRLRHRPWTSALWVGASLLLVGLATVPSQAGRPSLSSDPAARLRACVADPQHWLPPGLSTVGVSQLTAETLPNVALFVPLGVGIALVMGRSAWGWVLGAAALSMVIESYQAVLTTRVCSPVDVMANSLGAVLGYVLGVLALGMARRLHRDVGGPAAPHTGPDEGR